MPKPEIEFRSADEVAWRPIPGNARQREKILAVDEYGIGTRLLRFDPGCATVGIVQHDFWEEVWILDGAITDVTLGQTFSAGMYACRPPGMPHGPWVSPEGCTTFEVRYGQAPSPQEMK